MNCEANNAASAPSIASGHEDLDTAAPSIAAGREESDMVMVVEDEQKLQKVPTKTEESSDKTKMDKAALPASRSLPKDFASLVMNSIRRKPNPTKTTTTEAAPPQETPSVNATIAKETPSAPVVEDDHASLVLSPPDIAATTTAPVQEVHIMTAPPSPVNLDRDGDVATVVSQTMVVPSSGADLSGSVLSFKVDDAVSTMSDDLLQAMDEPLPEVHAPRKGFSRAGNVTHASPPCQGFPRTQTEITSEGVKAMAGELGLDAFMTVGDSLMRGSLVSEAPPKKHPEQNSDAPFIYKKAFKSLTFSKAAVLMFLCLVPVLFWSGRSKVAMNPFGVCFSKANMLLSSTKIRTTITGEKMADEDVAEGLVMDVLGIDALGASLFEPAVETTGDMDIDFASSSMNVSGWVDVSSITASPVMQFFTDRLEMQRLEIQARVQGSGDMGISYALGKATAKALNFLWRCALHLQTSLYYLVYYLSFLPNFCKALSGWVQSSVCYLSSLSKSCKAPFGWAQNSAHYLSSLPNFCKVLFGLVVVSSCGIAACVSFLLHQRGRNIAGDGARTFKKVKIPKQDKVEVPHGRDENPTGVDLSNYDPLRKVDLQVILRNRECRVSGKKDHLIRRLVEDYDEELKELSYKALQGRLKQQGLKQTGKKGDLVIRLLEAGF